MRRKKKILILVTILCTVAIIIAWNCRRDPYASIMDAVFSGDINRVKTLVAENPELIHTKDKFGCTLLHRAASVGQKEIAELLIKKGIEVNARDDFGQTPIHQAVEGTLHSLLGSYEEESDEIVMKLFRIRPKKANFVGPKKMAEFLIRNGADINAVDIGGRSVLYHAVNSGDKEVIEFLIEKGVDVNGKTYRHSLTPLYSAVHDGNSELVEILIANGAEVNTKTSVEGSSPLHWALFCGDNAIEVCKVLLENGADINAKNTKGLTPLQYAAQEGENEVAHFLRKYGEAE